MKQLPWISAEARTEQSAYAPKPFRVNSQNGWTPTYSHEWLGDHSSAVRVTEPYAVMQTKW